MATALNDSSSPEVLRVAKLGERIIGCYAMNELRRSMTKARKLLLTGNSRAKLPRQWGGRWLVGHAIGVAESKGRDI